MSAAAQNTNSSISQKSFSSQYSIVDVPLSPSVLGGGAVILDYHGKIKEMLDKYNLPYLAYRDMSVDGDCREAARGLFAGLRWAEGVEGAAVVYIAMIDYDMTTMAEVKATTAESDFDMLPGLTDRIFRACSGSAIRILDSGVATI